MTKIGVVIHTDQRKTLYSDESISKLNALGDVTWCDSATPISEDEAVAILADCEIGIGSWGTPGPKKAVVDGCPKLKLWVHTAGSVKHFFGDHLQGRDITIASCAPAIATGVAEMAVGEIIVGLRRIVSNVDANRAGGRPPAEGYVRVEDATIGILGASTVGREVIRLLQPFGARILIYDPFLSAEDATALGTEKYDDVTKLCAACHVVSLHTPAIPATKHIMGAEQFAAMRDGTVLVNTARGMCVDEAALIAELEKGRLFAFLDVSDPEPCADDSPLRKLPNAYYTSHIAGGPSFGLGRQAVADVEAFLNGKSPKMAVTADQLERLA